MMVAEVVYSIPGPPTRGGSLLTFSRDRAAIILRIDNDVDQVAPARYKGPACRQTCSDCKLLLWVVYCTTHGSYSEQTSGTFLYLFAGNRMGILYSAYPDDETALFYALAIAVMGAQTVPAEVEKAATLAAGVHHRQPEHPGALHYLIHIFDREGYAERGLSAARAYARSAPAIPYALHMPSHIFLRLGLWDEGARADAASFKASELAVAQAGGLSSDREFHNLMFEQYALS